MKKWYVITGILALLLVISISTCSGNSSQVDSLKDELRAANTELIQVREESKAELIQVREESKAELAKLQDDYKKLQEEYTVVQSTKEMVFGEGIRLFGIQWAKGYWGILEGKVQNISTEPMPTVTIIVAQYNQDGSLDGVYSTSLTDLFPQEVAEWRISGIFLEDGQRYEKPIEGVLGVYAFGNRS